MSSLRRSSLVPLARASVVSSMLLALGCSGGATADGRAFVGSPAAPATSSVSDAGTQDHTAYAVVPGSRARAQKLLVDAEEAFIAAPSGHYDVAWVIFGVSTTPIHAEFDLVIPAGRLEMRDGEQHGVDMRLIEGDIWTRPRIDGENGDCWMHFSRGTSQVARMSAILPGTYPLLEPHAVGFLDGGTRHQIVIDLLLDEAVAITLPKLANQAGTIDPEATIRATVTLEDGKYKSLEYRMIDTLEALERSHPVLVDEFRRKVGTPDQPWDVEVTYSEFGAGVAVSAPPPERVIDLGDPDELLSLSPDERPTGKLPTCEAQR